MTRERAKQLLPVIQAFAEGKAIEFFDEGEWHDIGEPVWQSGAKYRIKPTPREFWLVAPRDSATVPYSVFEGCPGPCPGREIIHVREVL